MSEGIVRTEVAIGTLHPNPKNPNEMTDAQFNLLCDNIERVGFTDPVLVRPHPSIKDEYEIVGGHHRWEVAKLFGYEKVPVTIVQVSDDEAAFQAVRHNIIHGQMSPTKFLSLYQSLKGEYSHQVAAEMFGFVNEEEFQKLIRTTKAGLPHEMQAKFQEASKEIKSIDDLARVLNRLFSTYGDSLPYGYMIFDFGGRDNIWLRMSPGQQGDFECFADKCRESGKSASHTMALLLQLIAKGGLEEVVVGLIEKAKEAEFTDDQLPLGVSEL